MEFETNVMDRKERWYFSCKHGVAVGGALSAICVGVVSVWGTLESAWRRWEGLLNP